MPNKLENTQLPQDELDLLGVIAGATLQRVSCLGYNAEWRHADGEQVGGLVEEVALEFAAKDPIHIHFRPMLFGEHVPTDCRIAVRRGGIESEQGPDDLNLAQQIEHSLNLDSPFVVAAIQVFEKVGGQADLAYTLGVGTFESRNCGDKFCNILAHDGRAFHISADTADAPEMTIDTKLPDFDKGTFKLRKILR